VFWLVETLSILMDLAYTSNSKLKVFKQYMWFTTVICDESILSSFSPQAYYFGSFVICRWFWKLYYTLSVFNFFFFSENYWMHLT
jgi:hypothetical protein